MPTAKKLPSGSWRCQAYSHTEKVFDEKTGKIKRKRVYESFYSTDPGPKGRKEAELAAVRFSANKYRGDAIKGRYDDLTLREGINLYINRCKALGRSPTTIHDYEIIRDYAFQDIMYMRMRDLNERTLQSAIYIISWNA